MTHPYAGGLWLPDDYSVRYEIQTQKYMPVVRRRFYKATETTQEVVTHLGGVNQQQTAHHLAARHFRQELKQWNTEQQDTL